MQRRNLNEAPKNRSRIEFGTEWSYIVALVVVVVVVQIVIVFVAAVAVLSTFLFLPLSLFRSLYLVLPRSLRKLFRMLRLSPLFSLR